MRTGRGRVAQWITRLTTDQKIPGSNPGVLALKLTPPLPSPKSFACSSSLRLPAQSSVHAGECGRRDTVYEETQGHRDR